MVKKLLNKNNIIILFISLFLFTKVNSLEWIDYDFTNRVAKKSFKNVEKKSAYGIDFGSGTQSQIPYYLKVEVESNDDNPAPLLCYSTSDQSCNSREQLAKNPNGKSVVIWVKREEFQKDDQELYIIVECPSNICSYTINVEGNQAAYFNSPNFAYSYLVGTYNKEMRFEINSSEKDVYMTVAIEGSSKATLDLESIYETPVDFKNGKIVTFFIENDESNSSIIGTITVKGAEVGEYITLTSHVLQTNEKYEGVTQGGVIEPNGPEIFGLLIEGTINEECFPIDFSNSKYNSMKQVYVTGRIHTKYSWFFLEDEKRIYLNVTDLVIYDGQLAYALKNEGKLQYVCFELPSDTNFKQSRVIFSFSLTEPKSLNSLYNYYPPQLTGEIYRRIIPKGSIAFFSGTKNDNSAKKYDYSLYQRKGLTKMYISDCKTYPSCNYDSDQLAILTKPATVNQMSIFTTYEDNSSAIGKEKYVIVAECVDDDKNLGGYCEFETSIFSKNQEITLVENEKFSKYVVKGEKGTFIASLESGRIVQRLNVDIMIFSGDVYFNMREFLLKNKLTDEKVQISYEKYYLSNKIFFHINFAQMKLEGDIFIDFSAELNSFFTIQYSVNSYNTEQLHENVPSGESYLVQINPTSVSKNKYIFLQNRFSKNKHPFLANFFALNCEFNVTRGNTPIEFFDGYAQEILDVSTSDYNNDYYRYNIKIAEVDLSNYNHKMCMLYVAGYEAEEDYVRDIVVGENINQQIIFTDNFKKIRFLYPHADPQKDLAIHINVIDKAIYKIKVISGNVVLRESNLAVTQTLYFRGSVISSNCGVDTLCPVVVEVEYYSEIIKTDPMIEITIREVLNTPTYLQKGQAKLDFVCGDKIYYLYTDIGKNELGEITLNFLREYGSIWARIVRKDQTSIDEEANWRGIYRMPSREWEDSLPFNGYTKKLIVSSEDTVDCIEGCYLLISIQVSQIGEYVDDNKFYPFSILTRITPSNRAYTDIPKVVIQVDEFVIGNVDVAQNERIYEFYEVWLPHDSERVEFDWQSSVAGLYINLGGVRPTTKNADFKLPSPGKDSMLYITKNDILEKARAKKVKIPNPNSLQDLSLVIGIWTDITDSINTELYSLRVHQPESTSSDSIDITEVNTDQKILCKPTQITSNEYRCLFMITYDDNDVKLLTPLFAYSESVNHGALTSMYADFIDRSYYDEFSKTDLTRNIPTSQTAEYNSKSDGVDYIYMKSLRNSKYLFINVISTTQDEVMMMTSMPVYNYLSYNIFDFSPNPSTEQLLNVPGEKLTLAFPESDSLMVNIVTLSGHAEISWDSDPNTVFTLRGWGDRISLSSGKKHDKINILRLLSNSINDNNKLKEMEDPGFSFYISYIAKDNNVKYDEISYGKSLEIAYKDVDLPVFLYSKIGTDYRDINVAITFRDNAIDEGGVHSSSPLRISSQIVKQSTLYNAKKDDDLRPSSERDIVGNYDTALKTAQVFLSEDIIKTFNIKADDNPTLYIRIDKNEKGEFADKTFEKFNVEAQVSGVNDGVIPVEKVYHYGRIRNTVWQSTFYRLKTDKNRPYMRIQIAFNSNNLDFVISDTDDYRRRYNITGLTTEKARGKVLVTFEIDKTKESYYLYIFKKERTQTETYLNNYAFKYINAKEKSEFFDFPIKDNSSEISINEEKINDEDIITCTFNKLDIEDGKANVTYFFKVVENSTHYYGEECDTIAVSESPYYTVYARNPSDNNGKITLTAKGKLSNWVYLNVIAQIQQNNILEYTAYTGKKNVRPPPKSDDNNGNSNENNNSESSPKKFLIAMTCILIIILIALIVIVVVFQLKNRNLLNQVKHVSFQNTNTNNPDPNLLLQKPQ